MFVEFFDENLLAIKNGIIVGTLNMCCSNSTSKLTIQKLHFLILDQLAKNLARVHSNVASLMLTFHKLSSTGRYNSTQSFNCKQKRENGISQCISLQWKVTISWLTFLFSQSKFAVRFSHSISVSFSNLASY